MKVRASVKKICKECKIATTRPAWGGTCLVQFLVSDFIRRRN